MLRYRRRRDFYADRQLSARDSRSSEAHALSTQVPREVEKLRVAAATSERVRSGSGGNAPGLGSLGVDLAHSTTMMTITT